MSEAKGGLVDALNSDVVVRILDLVRRAFPSNREEDTERFVARKDLPEIAIERSAYVKVSLFSSSKPPPPYDQVQPLLFQSSLLPETLPTSFGKSEYLHTYSRHRISPPFLVLI